jgi:hypothetical protein
MERETRRDNAPEGRATSISSLTGKRAYVEVHAEGMTFPASYRVYSDGGTVGTVKLDTPVHKRFHEMAQMLAEFYGEAYITERKWYQAPIDPGQYMSPAGWNEMVKNLRPRDRVAWLKEQDHAALVANHLDHWLRNRKRRRVSKSQSRGARRAALTHRA